MSMIFPNGSYTRQMPMPNMMRPGGDLSFQGGAGNRLPRAPSPSGQPGFGPKVMDGPGSGFAYPGSPNLAGPGYGGGVPDPRRNRKVFAGAEPRRKGSGQPPGGDMYAGGTPYFDERTGGGFPQPPAGGVQGWQPPGAAQPIQPQSQGTPYGQQGYDIPGYQVPIQERMQWYGETPEQAYQNGGFASRQAQAPAANAPHPMPQNVDPGFNAMRNSPPPPANNEEFQQWKESNGYSVEPAVYNPQKSQQRDALLYDKFTQERKAGNWVPKAPPAPVYQQDRTGEARPQAPAAAPAPRENSIRIDPDSGKTVTYKNGQWTWHPNPVSGPQPYDTSRFGDGTPPGRAQPVPPPSQGTPYQPSGPKAVEDVAKLPFYKSLFVGDTVRASPRRAGEYDVFDSSGRHVESYVGDQRTFNQVPKGGRTGNRMWDVTPEGSAENARRLQELKVRDEAARKDRLSAALKEYEDLRGWSNRMGGRSFGKADGEEYRKRTDALRRNFNELTDILPPDVRREATRTGFIKPI